MNLNLFIGVAGTTFGVIVAALAWGGTAAIQYLAAIFGASGALLFAVPGVHPIWGFAAFLISNFCWLYFASQQRHRGLFWQQVAFLVTSLVGIWNWWLGPLVLS